MKVADIKKKQESAARELEKLGADLAGLKDQRAALADEINIAIDADDFAKVEKLTAQMTGIDNKIRAAELIISRKKETGAVKHEEIIGANNIEMKEWQKRIDKAQAAADAALNDHLVKLLEVAALVNQAWTARAEYVQLIPGIEDPFSVNAQTGLFDVPMCRIDSGKCKVWREPLQAIRPDALAVLEEAARNHINQYAGRDLRSKDPGVVISKY